MTAAVKAHDFPEIFAALGYDLSGLGCIMLNVEAESLLRSVREVVRPEDEYFAADPKRFWITGITADKPHVTLLYGLLRPGLEWQIYVDKVLEGNIPAEVEIDHVGFFPSPYADEDYLCIVAHLVITPALQEANERLKFLPHINTFPGYKAHVTLAYIKHDDERGTMIVDQLNKALSGSILRTEGLDYGGDK